MSRTWCVEMTSVRPSVMLRATTRRNWLFEGMSRPFVGSSISRSRVFVASAKLM